MPDKLIHHLSPEGVLGAEKSRVPTLERSHFDREIQVTVTMTLENAKLTAEWILHRVQELEDAMKAQREKIVEVDSGD